MDISFAKDRMKIFVLLEGNGSSHVGAKPKQFLDPRHEFLSSLDAKEGLDPTHTLQWTVKKMYDAVILRTLLYNNN